MKLRILIFALVVCWSTVGAGFGQRGPATKLFDRVPLPANCENVLIGVDRLIEELKNEPESTGYIVVDRR